MSDVSYPSGLPIPALQGSITVSASGETTKMDSGRSRHRQVSAKAYIVADVQWVLTEEEFSVFKNWFEVDLEDGTLKFDMNMFNFSVYVGAVFASPDYKIQRDDNVFTVTGQLILDKLDNSFPSFQIGATAISMCEMEIYITALDTGGQSYFYSVYRATGPTNYYDPNNYTQIGTIPGTSSPQTFIDPTVEAGVTYYYQVKAQVYGDICPFAASNIASQAPPDGILLTGQTTGLYSNHLYWTLIGGNAVYSIYRSTDSSFTPGPSSFIGTNTTGIYDDTGLSPGTTYLYIVTGVSDCPGTQTSNEIHLTTEGNPPGSFVLTATSVGLTKVNLSWTTPSGTTPISYSVYRSEAGGTWSQILSNVSYNNYQDTGLDVMTTYSYYVVATNILGSKDSNTSSISTAGSPLFWFKSDAGVTSSGSPLTVTQWNDQSGNGYNATVPTGGTGPLLITDSAHNNMLGLEGYYGGSTASGLQFSPFKSPTSYTILAVMGAPSSSYGSLVNNSGPPLGNILSSGSGTTGMTRYDGGNSIHISANAGGAGSVIVIALSCDPSNTTNDLIRINAVGQSLVSNSATGSITDFFQYPLLMSFAGASYPPATFYEIICWSGDLALVDIQAVETYLNYRYAVY